MSKGIVYILTNEAMPGYTKIGMTTTSVEQRMKDLDSTGIPLPFECQFAALVEDMEKVEKLLHDAFDDHRIRKRREFFQISPDRVRAALLIAGGEDVTPREEVVEEREDIAALNKAKKQRSRFNFSMVGLKPGTVLTHTRDESINCVVINNTKVEFEGETSSLSKSALIVMHRLGYKWTTINGPAYWKYRDESLQELMLRKETEGE